MKKAIARNISIPDLVSTLVNIILDGNKYVDILIDDDYVLRLRGFRNISRKEEIKEEPKKQSLPKGIKLTDLM